MPRLTEMFTLERLETQRDVFRKVSKLIFTLWSFGCIFLFLAGLISMLNNSTQSQQPMLPIDSLTLLNSYVIVFALIGAGMVILAFVETRTITRKHVKMATVEMLGFGILIYNIRFLSAMISDIRALLILSLIGWFLVAIIDTSRILLDTGIAVLNRRANHNIHNGSTEVHQQ